ncbi:MAG: formate dehydrogenase accessory protein FdhE [Gemmobacter sp.]
MTQKTRAPQPDPTSIGNIAKPPFTRLPDPATIFANRAARLRALAEGSDLGDYLDFLASLAGLQAEALADTPAPALPGAEVLARAAQHEMPPLDRAAFTGENDPAFDALFDRMLDGAGALAMPEAAREALARLKDAGPLARAGAVANVMADAIPAEEVAEHALLAAVLQVHFARLAAGLDPESLKPVGDGVCPACGGAPVSSLVVGWKGAEGTRFCSCSLCGTLWNYVRSRCTLCGSTRDISFREVETGGDTDKTTVKAECCGACRGYVKVFYQQQDPALDPVADDVASLGLDLLMRDLDFRRGAVNPFLTGY